MTEAEPAGDYYIIFMRAVYLLKYPTNTCLSCLDNGSVIGMQFI